MTLIEPNSISLFKKRPHPIIIWLYAAFCCTNIFDFLVFSLVCSWKLHFAFLEVLFIFSSSITFFVRTAVIRKETFHPSLCLAPNPGNTTNESKRRPHFYRHFGQRLLARGTSLVGDWNLLTSRKAEPIVTQRVNAKCRNPGGSLQLLQHNANPGLSYRIPP